MNANETKFDKIEKQLTHINEQIKKNEKKQRPLNYKSKRRRTGRLQNDIKKTKKNKQREQCPKESTIFIKAIKENTKFNETKANFVTSLKTKSAKINIMTIKPRGPNALVELEKSDDVPIFKECLANSKEIKAEDVRKRHSKIKIIGLDKNTDIEVTKTDIIERNFLNQGMKLDELKRDI